MAQRAILHTATRVIRRITTDDEPQVGPDETVVELGAEIDLAGGPWKLDVDAKTRSIPSRQEIDDSDVDEGRRETLRQAFFQGYIDLLNAIVAGEPTVAARIADLQAATTNAQVTAAVKAWASAQGQLNNGIRVFMQRHEKIVRGMVR